ncbi:LysE type translocator [Polaribacter dokdonensis DSW-5]|uniref:LysE type translocator n=2 Tax=Polaribacter TaxID=52959 RepID=A0A0N0CFB9_9FLAO|nr:LysE family transporter [Polaribacter dokdonensis]KOY51657.1 LysE type translocator [Polaribacter dokdonensis DSW-5]SEE06191.1 Threonine/homoserine/homoserine lactone efflux protein [Polaribacter dokdonensis DSW-5]
MNVLSCIFFGFIIASMGSITPSFLNLTVVKFSLRNGVKSALYLIGGYATVLFFQANIGAYLSSILMENSEYITLIQQIGTVILFLLSINFFRLYFSKKEKKKSEDIPKSKAYFHGILMSSLNTMAIPFYFTFISILIGMDYFTYNIFNALYFSIGSTIGSFTLYTLYAILSKRIEHKLTYIASKMDFILGALTGILAVGNAIYLLS